MFHKRESRTPVTSPAVPATTAKHYSLLAYVILLLVPAICRSSHDLPISTQPITPGKLDACVSRPPRHILSHPLHHLIDHTVAPLSSDVSTYPPYDGPLEEVAALGQLHSQVYAYNYTAPPRAVARGVQSLGNMLRLRRFADKLLKGESVDIAAAGGSISKGWGDSAKRTNDNKGYVGRFTEWAQKTFSAEGQQVVNKGGPIGAVMSPMYAACTSRIVKESADLIFVEFVQNDMYRPSGKPMEKDPRRKAFERLVQNLLAYPKQPAVVIYMVFPHTDDFWRSAENDMLVIAQHYQLPVISVRSAFYPLMAQGVHGFRLDGTYNEADRTTRQFFWNFDNVHPWARSYQYMAELAIYLVQQAMQSVVEEPFAATEQAAIDAGLDVPQPMFPGNIAGQSNNCMLNDELHAAVVPGSEERFEWWDEGRRKWGWWTNSTSPGASVTLQMSTKPARALPFVRSAQRDGHAGTAEAPEGTREAVKPVTIAFGCMHSGTKPMGIAEVSCVSGCECEATRINARWDAQVSLTHITAIKASAHLECRIRFKMLEETETAGHLFKISVMMVFDYAGKRTSANDLFGDLNVIHTVERMTKMSGPFETPPPTPAVA